MDDRFKDGDFLFFQLEAGFALLRLLGVEQIVDQTVWHLAAYNDLFLDVESIESAVGDPTKLTLAIPHVALSDRAFTATQVAAIGNSPLANDEILRLAHWRGDPEREISDRSIRLITGLR